MRQKSFETRGVVTTKPEPSKLVTSPPDRPNGVISMSGKFVTEHRHEILELVLSVEEGHRSAHPEDRFIGTKDEQDGSVVMTFTSAPLARTVAETLYRTHWGELDTTYTDQREKVYISWWC